MWRRRPGVQSPFSGGRGGLARSSAAARAGYYSSSADGSQYFTGAACNAAPHLSLRRRASIPPQSNLVDLLPSDAVYCSCSPPTSCFFCNPTDSHSQILHLVLSIVIRQHHHACMNHDCVSIVCSFHSDQAYVENNLVRLWPLSSSLKLGVVKFFRYVLISVVLNFDSEAPLWLVLFDSWKFCSINYI